MPDVYLSGAIATMRPGDDFRIANAARPAGNYLFNSILPEVLKSDYQARSGSMTVRSAMPGMVGADSPYPDTMALEVSTFSEETAKFANKVRLPERTLRELQAMVQRLMLSGQSSNDAVVREALNFLDKVIVQGHLDLMEYLRGMALCTGGIDWTFNGIRLLVDYAIPSANKLTARTGTDGYGGSASKFWTDVRSIRRLLKGNVRALLAHPDLIDTIRYNPANSLVTISEGNGSITFRKVNSQGNFTQDAGDTITLISYGLEGEILDPVSKGVQKLPFHQKTKLVGVANNTGTNYIVGAGSTTPPENILGYTHIAPTVEGGGTPGRWAQVYTPEDAPWSLEGRGVTNGLPVIEAPDKIVIATSEIA